MNNENNNEARVTADWEPQASVQKKDARHPYLKRKLLTTGIERFRLPMTLEQIRQALRQGKEVRFYDGGENDAIRIFPLLSRDCKTIYPVAETMGDFRDCLSDLKPHVMHNRKELNDMELRREVNAQRAKYEAGKEATRLSVTPDTMVTCPNCGTEFRVGRQLG